MPGQIKVASVQMVIEETKVDANVKRMEDNIIEAARHGAQLIVFPECALAGYCFDTKEETWGNSEPIPGPTSQKLTTICKQWNTFVVTGLLEREGQTLYNSAMLIGPDGVLGTYRKTHLPFMGADRFVAPGNKPYEVFTLPGLDVKIGILICFDGGFPEPCRILSLLGADLIVLPTNWPEGALCSSMHIPAMRAMENHNYFLSSNRVGSAYGFKFIGKSRLTDWTGNDLGYLPDPKDGILYGMIDPSAARKKRVINIPGVYEVDRIAARRPELYSDLTKGNRT